MRSAFFFSRLAVVSLVALAGCTTTATVVSSSNGPSIQQVQREPANGPKYRIAVSAFDYKAAKHSDVGDGMADMLSNALFNTNRFIVLEREHLDEVTAEQDLSNSKRFNKSTAAPVGQLEGAQLLIRGSITAFEPSCKGGSIIIASTKQACVTVNIRIIDAATGRVVNATTVDGTSANNGIGFVFTGPDLPIGLGAFSKTPMEVALRNCIETAVNHIVNSKLN
ncbi:MAG: CsgG/HfaB family protein [Nevskia sp.]|jgi:curli biogenesis system outer membrane secretion channel CsgG|nr:CsgG/HfaB family protein [Nevskia sp.]MCK9386013.1 CsgG/HfaB family protein [Nevskia sp.]